MKQRILYQAYCGGEPYIFLRFDRSDENTAALIVNNLIERQFRVFYDRHDGRELPDSEELAVRILSAHLAVFLISEGALASLEFRNSINYALSKKKKIFCIYLDDKKMDYGFDIQLANIPGASLSNYRDAADLCGDIVTTKLFMQTMRGGDAKKPMEHARKKKAAIIAIAAVLVVFIISAFSIAAYRINYENSTAGQIEKITRTDYLDISDEDASLIDLLEGKTIGALKARNMGLENIDALAGVNCEEIDLSQNPHVSTLEPLLKIKNLQVVKITQDMAPAAAQLHGRHSFRIVITE
jgi:hypothetical protein